jgi:glycine/D-amino acid oxidase-like deaminating enzyme
LTRSLSGSVKHAIVCGAGVVGAATAYFLAKHGVRVTLVERSGVACAASGKSGGFLALDWCDDSPLGPLARASFALHAELATELPGDHGYRRMDTFMLAARERGAVGGGHRLAAPAWLDGAGVVTAALGTTDTTAQVDPARFTEALVAGAQARGAALRMGVVERVAIDSGAVRGVVVDGVSLEADAVVLALGPWTGHVGGVRLPRVYGLKGYSVTLAAGDMPAHALFVDYRTAEGRALEPEIFPREKGEVYVCGMADPAPLPDSPDEVTVNAAMCDVLARVHRAGRSDRHQAAGLLPAGHRRRAAADRPRARRPRRLRGHRPWPVGDAERAGHRPRSRRADRDGRVLAGPRRLRSSAAPPVARVTGARV